MVQIDKNNTGFATKNKYATSNKHPKFKGVVKVNDVQMEVAVWVKQSLKTGDSYLSFSFQSEEEASKYKNHDTNVDNPNDSESANVSEDELPF